MNDVTYVAPVTTANTNEHSHAYSAPQSNLYQPTQ